MATVSATNKFITKLEPVNSPEEFIEREKAAGRYREITVEVRSVYGRDTIYPVCDAAKAFARIAGTKTLSVDVVKRIMFLGYEVKYQLPRSHLYHLADVVGA